MKEHREIQTLIDQLETYIKKQDEAIKALQKTNQYLVAQLLQAPAQFEREWVGLTDDEINKIVDLNTSDDGGFDIWCDGIAVAHIVCAKIKELNK